MKNKIVTVTTFLAGLFLAASAFGAEQMIDQSSGQSLSTQPIQTELHSADQFIGTQVRDVNGNKIGEVKDLLFDFNRGIGYAVVEDEELTRVDKNLLVPLSAFTSTHEGNYVSLPVTKESLANYPERAVGMDDETYGRNVYEYYGISYPWGEEEQPLENEIVPGSERQNRLYPTGQEIQPGVGN